MANTQLSLNQTIMSTQWQNYLQQVLGEKKEQFVTSCISLVRQNATLQECDPTSVITAAMSAACLNLSTDPNLGESYVIPYGNQCTFQIGYLGFIQLALQTGQFARLNVTDVREGEIKFDRLSGDATMVDIEDRETKPIVGYAAYMRLVNGFEKTLYMTVDELKQHGQKYSKSGKLWQSDFDKMAQKTVLKMLLRKFAPKSFQKINNAIAYDQAVLKPDFKTGGIEAQYIDRKEPAVETDSDIANESIVVEANESEEAV